MTQTVPDTRTSLSRKLLERLICPVSRGPLEYEESTQMLISRRAGLKFPVRDGIPILIEDEAEQLLD